MLFKFVEPLDSGEILGFAQNVGVDPECGGWVRMTEPLRYLVDRDTGPKPTGGGEVPEVVDRPSRGCGRRPGDLSTIPRAA